MGIGFLDENEHRGYPMIPSVPRVPARSIIVDALLMLGSGARYDVIRDRAAIWSITQSGVDWLFQVITWREELVGFGQEFTVSIPNGAKRFSSWRAFSEDDLSYVTLTVGDISRMEEFEAESIDTALVLEDRTVVAPQRPQVTSCTFMPTEPRPSFKPNYEVISPVNPVVNYYAARGNYQYDPYIVNGCSSIQNGVFKICDGANSTVSQQGNKVTVRSSVGGGEGPACDVEVPPEDQTIRGTVRSIAGRLPSLNGNFDLEVGGGSVETVPQEHKIIIRLTPPLTPTKEDCLIGVEQEVPPPFPDPDDQLL